MGLQGNLRFLMTATVLPLFNTTMTQNAFHDQPISHRYGHACAHYFELKQEKSLLVHDLSGREKGRNLPH